MRGRMKVGLRGLGFVVVMVFLCAAVGVGYGKVIYVDMDAGGVGDGTSWADAYPFLQDALIDANSAARPLEVRVAAGVYRPSQCAADPNGGSFLFVSFRVENGMSLLGGYAGVGEVEPDSRDFGQYETILDGDYRGNDEEVLDVNDLIYGYRRRDNACHVVIVEGNDPGAVIDGVTIRGGNAMCWYENDMGGGIYNIGATASVSNCIFVNNSSFVGGGAIYSRDGHLTVTDCLFSGNDWAVHVTRGDADFSRCLFVGNVAISDGAAFSSGWAEVHFSDCEFEGNLATDGWGGAVRNYLGSWTMENCTFKGNKAGWEGYGGAIYLSGGETVLRGCEFTGNISATHGGALAASNADVRVSHCIFDGNVGPLSGGAIRSNASTVSLINSTFYGNTASNGRAVATADGTGASGGLSSIEMRNCVVWDAYPIRASDGSQVSVSYTDIQGGWAGVGNLDADPLFADADGGDFHLRSQGGRWLMDDGRWTRDEVTSPCVDAGDPWDAIGLEVFANGGRVNMGVYGATGQASKSWFGGEACETIVAGDVNGDCKVDFADFAIMVLHWLR